LLSPNTAVLTTADTLIPALELWASEGGGGFTYLDFWIPAQGEQRIRNWIFKATGGPWAGEWVYQYGVDTIVSYPGGQNGF